MNLDQDIRTVLRARAEGVTAAPVIPHGTLRRVRVRKTLMIGGVATAVAALLFGGLAASRSLWNDAAPLPPAEKTEERDATLVDFPKLTTTFVSRRNGFSIKHPDNAVLRPANVMDGWDPGDEESDGGVDVVETSHGVVFKGASIKAPEWEGSIDGFVDDITPGGCGATRSQHAEITIDGRSGWIAECPGEIDALVVAGGRLYLFTLLHDRNDARAVFDAFSATIDLTPETAQTGDPNDVPTWVSVLEGMTKTFVSPTHGYSFKYLDRGGLEPAKGLWDPANQPSPVEGRGGYGAEYMDEFDVVETGYGAIFMSASTNMPEGVPVDQWIDEVVAKYLSPGCYAPRSQQEQITIDGQPGRIVECPGVRDTDPRETIDTSTPGETHATVVVGRRLYLFVLIGPRGEGARMVFDAWLATIELTPETAAAP